MTEDHIRSLDMMGVEQAYDEIRKEQTDSGKKFFCVGYSIVKYYLNGYPMEMIEMHMANYIEVELIATFCRKRLWMACIRLLSLQDCMWQV